MVPRGAPRFRPLFEAVEARVLCAAGFAVTPVSGLVTTEAGGKASFTVALTQAPVATVTVPISSSNTLAGTVSTASLVVTTTNWNAPQTVVVTGVDDHLADGNIAYQVVTGPAKSSDANYNNLNPVDVSLTNLNIDVSSMALLGTMDPTVVGVADLLGYSAPGDGGGGTFVWTAGDAAADNGGTVIASSVAGAPAGRWVRQYSGALDPRWFGAVGNGTTDDTAALQAALNAAAGGGALDLVAGHTYLVSFAGNKTIVQGGGPFYQRYCLAISSGTTFNLEGATLRLAAGQNAAILINQDPNFGVAGDSNITIENGTFDSNAANQTAPASGSMPGLFLSNCTGAATTALTFNNVRDLAMYWQDVSNSTANQLLSTSSDGDGFFFGFYSPTSPYDGRVKNSTIGTIEADDCQSGLYTVGSFTRQGNPVEIAATGCSFGTITADDCASAILIVDGSSNDTIAKAVFNGATGGARTANDWGEMAGVRVQGNGAGHDPQGVTITEADVSDVRGPGLYIQNAESDSVATYNGTSDGESGTDPDVWLGTSSGISLGQVNSTGAGQEGVYVTSGANLFTITRADVANPSQLTAAEPGVEVEGTNGTIGQVIAADTTGRMRYALAAFGSTASAAVSQILSVGATASAFRTASTAVTAGTVVTDPIEAAAGSLTMVAVTPISGLVTTESGGTASYTVVLLWAPKATVTIPISSSNTLAGTVSAASLVFTTANWSTPQTVTLTGVHDATRDYNVSYAAVTGPASSADASYNGVNAPDISAIDLNIDAFDLADLRTISPLAATTVSVQGYAAPGDGGGGTFVWTAGDAAADNGGTIIASSVAGAPAGRWVRQYTGALDPRWFGAVGNGTTDDTAALQAALNAAAGGGTLDLLAGHTYLVSFAGNKTIVQGDGPFFQRYCLAIGSGTTFNLEGATLRLAAGQNAAILINQDPNFGGAGDSNITIENGTFDSDQADQTAPASGSMPGVFLSNCTGAATTALTFNNVRDLAMYWQDVSNSTANQLLSTYSDGDGFFFGFYSPTSPYDGRVYNSTIGTIEADNCQQGLYTAGSFTREGNPVLMNAVDCTFGTIVANNCGGGVKVTDGSYGDSIGEVIFNGATGSARTATNWTNNSGLKIQGNGVGYDPQNITVGVVDSSNCYGSGLYIQYAENDSVATYNGTSNGQSGVNPDVWLGTSSGISLGQVNSTDAGQEGVMVQPTANLFTITRANVANPSQLTPTQPAVEVEGTNGTIGQVVGADSTGQMGYALAAFQSTGSAAVSQVLSVGATGPAFQTASTGVTAGTVISDPAEAAPGALTMVAVSPISVLQTTESGGKASYTVVLLWAPKATVTIPISSSNTLAGTVSSSSLVFTTSNWSTPQTVTLTGVHNTALDYNVSYTVVTGPASSTDSSYNGVNCPDVPAIDLNIDAFDLADLRTISPLAATTVSVQGYAAPGDGGGGTFVWTAGDAAAANGGTIIASSVAGAPAGRWVRQYTGALDPRWFGAVGNGTTDDTAALQAALNAAAGGGALDLVAGDTYLVSFAGNKTIVQGGGPFFQRYCLAISSGTTFNLEGATLRLAAGQNAAILINQDPNFGVAGDSNITIENGTFDSDQADQTAPASGSMPGVFLSNCTGAATTALTFNNVRDLAMYWQDVSNSTANQLLSTSSDGDGFFFGFYSPTSPYDGRVKNSTIGTIEADDCQSGLYTVGSFTRQGNPVEIAATGCSFGTITADDCASAILIVDGSSNDTIAKAVFNGAPGAARTASDWGEMAGVRVQGNGAGHDPQGVTITEADVSDVRGPGLYIQNAESDSVATYNGTSDGESGTDPDVWLGTSSGISLGQVNSTGAGQEGVYVTSGANLFTITRADVANPSQLTAAEPGVEVEGTNGTIGQIIAADSTGRMRYTFAVYTSTASATVGTITSTGATAAPARVQSAAVTVTSIIADPQAPTSGTLTLAAGSTSTVIPSNDVWQLGVTGGTFEPVITLTPLNSAATALGSVTVTISTSPKGFTLKYAAAKGTEQFSWTITKWVFVPTP